MDLYNLLLVSYYQLKYNNKYLFIYFGLEADTEENEGETEEGTYFVDQAGHYYYQAKGETQPVMTVMPNLNDSGGDDAEEFIINQDNEEENEQTEEVSV